MPEDPRPRPRDDAPPVPPIGEDDGPDEAPDALDLPLGFGDETDDEDLLDDRTGESDEIEALDEPLGSEDGWTEDSDPDEQDRDDDEAGTDAEDGWTDDADSPGTDDEWEEDLLPDAKEPSVTEVDTGEEGIDESEIADPAELEPEPLEESGEEDDDEVGGPETLEEPEEEEPAWDLPPDADPASVLVHFLGPADQGVTGLALGEDEIWAAGGDAFTRVGERLERVEDPALEGALVQSVAIVRGPAGPVVALGTVVGGCLVRRTREGGFEPANGWTHGRTRAAFAVSASESVLIGRTSEGALHRSADAGETWVRLDPGGRALAASISGGRLFVVVARADGAIHLATSDEEGASFSFRTLPTAARPGPEVSLSVVGRAVLIAAEEIGAMYSSDGGETFTRWTCPVALAGALDPVDPRTAYLSLFHAAEDEGAIAATRDAGASFVTVALMSQLRRVFRLVEQGDPDGDNRIHAIVPDPRAPGRIHLASAAGAFVLAVKL